MANAQALCTSFKFELLNGVHKFDGTQQYKIALYKPTASVLNATTTAYGIPSGELDVVAGNGYISGGKDLTISAYTSTPSTDSTGTAWVDFADVVWANATWGGVTYPGAQYALIYNSTASNKAVAVLDFGSEKTVTGSAFTVQFPAAAAGTAIIRIQ